MYEEAIGGLCLAIARRDGSRTLFLARNAEGRWGLRDLSLRRLLARCQIICIIISVPGQFPRIRIFVSIVGTSKESGGGRITLKLGLVGDAAVGLRRRDF